MGDVSKVGFVSHSKLSRYVFVHGARRSISIKRRRESGLILSDKNNFVNPESERLQHVSFITFKVPEVSTF